jgi:hypothetical protein
MWRMVLTLCQMVTERSERGKLFVLGGVMWITFLDFVILSGERCMGDNPLDTYFPTFYHYCFPLFTTDNSPHVYEKTTFSPLTLSGGPVFYYI